MEIVAALTEPFWGNLLCNTSYDGPERHAPSENRGLACVEFYGVNEPANRSRYSASAKRCWALAVSNTRSRQRRSMPSLVICTPSTGCSSSSSSEYSFDRLNIIPSDPSERETRK